MESFARTRGRPPRMNALPRYFPLSSVGPGGSAALKGPLGGGPRQLGGGAEAELVLDPLAVGLDRVDAALHPAGDLGGGQAGPDQAEDLELAIGEGLDRRSVAPRDPPDGAPQESIGHRL